MKVISLVSKRGAKAVTTEKRIEDGSRNTKARGRR